MCFTGNSFCPFRSVLLVIIALIKENHHYPVKRVTIATALDKHSVQSAQKGFGVKILPQCQLHVLRDITVVRER